MVVGGADVMTGNRWGGSGIGEELGIPHVYGPGENVISAEGNKAKWGSNSNGKVYKITEGTSVGESSPPFKTTPLEPFEEASMRSSVC